MVPSQKYAARSISGNETTSERKEILTTMDVGLPPTKRHIRLGKACGRLGTRLYRVLFDMIYPLYKNYFSRVQSSTIYIEMSNEYWQCGY